jgi:hypothetical protein
MVLHIDVTALQMQASQLDERAQLSQSSEHGFRLAFSFMLPTFADNPSVMQAAGSTRRLLWSESLIADHLVQAKHRLLFTLEQTLITAGQTIPSGLATAQVTSRPGALTLINKMVIWLPQWIIEKWEPCNCAGQTQSRRVQCSVDHVESCHVSGAEPPAEQSCKCLQPRPWLGLDDYVKVLIGAGIGAFCLLCACCCILEIRRYCRNTRNGRCRLRDSREFVNFKVQDEKETDGKGKVCVIFDIDETHLKIFQRTSDKADKLDDTTAEGGHVGPETRPTKAVANPTSLNATSQDLYPVYKQGASVQYFSVTHKCWLSACIHLRFNRDELGIKRVCYSIQVGQSTVRNDVPLDMLRLSPAAGENGEVFMKRGDGGFWVPGIISGQQFNGKTAPDYKIQLLDKTLDRVSASRVRRHFAAGVTVEVYRGSAEGWVPALVQERLGTLEYPAPLSQNSPHPQGGEESPVLDAPHPWVNVPIVEKMQCGSPMPEDVPLWLLRQPIAEPDKEENNGVASLNGSAIAGFVGTASASQWAHRMGIIR